VAGIYLILGHGWTALTHLILAAALFAVFYSKHHARERAVEERRFAETEDNAE
jgi:hypothetical protein